MGLPPGGHGTGIRDRTGACDGRDARAALMEKTRRLAQNALRFVLNHEINRLSIDRDGIYVLKGGWEHKIRPPAQTASALGVAFHTGIYDPAVIGIPLEEARRIHVRLVRSLALRHKSHSPGKGWGNQWQSAHWAAMTAFGVLAAPELFDSQDCLAVERMVRHEAARFDCDPPYSNEDKSDSKAEENAWNANVLVLAAAMMPAHPDAARWRQRASQWLVSAYSRPSDLENRTSVDGRPVADWLGGYNMFEDGYVYNHGRLHPDYMAAIELQLWNVLFVSLTGQRAPEAALWNAGVVYGCLVEHVWESPPFDPPGGTIYVDGAATVYYPQGTDWSPMRVDNYFIVDVLMSVLGQDGGVSVKGDTWARVRADFLLEMQSRTDTGQLFVPADGLEFPPKESFAALHFCYAYLALWLEQQDRISPIGKWLPDAG